MVGKPPRNTPIGREASNEENASEGRPVRGTCPARAACRIVKTNKVRYCLVGASLLGAVRGAHFHGMMHRYPRPDCDGLVTCLATTPDANCSTSLTATYGIALRLVSSRTRFVEDGLMMPNAWACSRMLFLVDGFLPSVRKTSSISWPRRAARSSARRIRGRSRPRK